MSPIQKMGIGAACAWALAIALIWLLFVYIPRVKVRRKVKKLRVGFEYALDGKDPFKTSRAVIDQIQAGYVAYRIIVKLSNGEDYLGSLDSMKAEKFACIYERCSVQGVQP